MKIEAIKTLWPEKEDFFIERNTGERYIFIHLLTEAYISEGREMKLYPAGSVVCYPENSYQYIASIQGGLLHNWMHILGSDFERMAEKYGFSLGKIYKVDDGSFITEIMQSCEREFMRKFEHYEDICEMKISELLIRIMRSVEAREHVSDTVFEAFSAARSKIHMDYAKNWTISDMAELMHLSPSRFFAVYKSVFGTSPKEDLINVRMEHARIFLATGKYSVKEVSEMTGYSNVYHFIRSYKAFSGKTPGKYKNEI